MKINYCKCDNCGAIVHDSYKYCPACLGRDFVLLNNIDIKNIENVKEISQEEKTRIFNILKGMR